ncbi:GtrA family protein [Pseudomonas graminis]
MIKVFSKYIAVGLVNTALTAIIIFSLTFLGSGVYTANMLGYVAGIILSFLLNSLFTFKKTMSFPMLGKFLTVCLISYLLNLVVMKISLTVFSDHHYMAQFLGMCIYTLSGFILNKKWALK